jgi:beta-galactosidase/beta-glucuronidase
MQDSPTQDAIPESTAPPAGLGPLGQGSGARVKRGSHPRPQLRRGSWASLDGPWSFALEPGGDRRRQHPSEVVWDRTILVPFAPETPRSGIGETGFIHACWYRRTITTPDLSGAAGGAGGAGGDRLLLHFGAVDYQATVWVDGCRAGEHEGGYTPFTIDLTEWARTPGEHEIVVLAEDDPTDLAKPRGKQDWLRDPHSIWYPRATGIWRTVWLERVPATRIASLRWRCNLERWEIELATVIQGAWRDGMRLRVKLQARDTVLADDVYGLLHSELHRRIALSDPGIDDSRNALLWSPESPTIIDAEIELLAADGACIDRVRSYTALRAIGVQGDRVVLNGRPYPLLMVLDQGYWPETGQTAPDTQALRRDVLLAKAMGFNGVRKHQKIEDPRFLYWADHLGLLVWEEMPSAYRYTQDSIRRVTREWMAVIERDYSHPSIIAWVPFNESWGVPNLPDNPAERHFVQAIYHLTKTLDPTRLVVGNDGWESVATDIIGIHDYLDTPERMARRYQSHEIRPQLLGHERPGGRLLVLGNEEAHAVHPIILSEFGGIALIEGSPEGSWGYSRCGTAEQLAANYAELLGVVRSLQLLAGFCYTQFADTYQEANGLLRADRTPKIPLEQIHAATRGRLTGALDEFSIQLIDSPRHEGFPPDAFEPV